MLSIALCSVVIHTTGAPLGNMKDGHLLGAAGRLNPMAAYKRYSAINIWCFRSTIGMAGMLFTTSMRTYESRGPKSGGSGT